jgi:hypothetical protein
MDRCCGPDIRKDSVFACILDSHGVKVFEQRFGTLTGKLTGLSDLPVDYDCGRVAMESTETPENMKVFKKIPIVIKTVSKETTVITIRMKTVW